MDLQSDRRTFLGRCIALLEIPPLLALWRPSQSRAEIASELSDDVASLRFLLIGDWGREGAHHQQDVANAMSVVAAKIKPRFIISTGDNFYEDGVQSAQDPQWQISYERVYGAESLQIPWHVVLGNHDYHGKPDAQISYSKISARWHLPARYYQRTETWAGHSVDFFFLDTNPFVTEYRQSEKMAAEIVAQNTSEQISWLDKALAVSRSDWKIVIGHHPIYSGGTEHGSQAELIERLNPILEKHRVPAYFNGHDHDLQHIVRGSINYFTSGAGSKVRLSGAIDGTQFYLGTPGFMAAGLTAERLSVELTDFSGKVLYQTAIAPSGAALASAPSPYLV